MESTAGSITRNPWNEKPAILTPILSVFPSVSLSGCDLPFLLFLCIAAAFPSPLQISISAASLAHLEMVPGLIITGPDWVT